MKKIFPIVFLLVSLHSSAQAQGLSWRSDSLWLFRSTEDSILIYPKANIANPTFTGTVGGITASMVGLGNVTNESKATMFTSPTFTGTIQTFNQNTTGSAATLTTARLINGVSFNGSSNVTVPSDISPGTNGNVLTSNGTVWTSAAPPGGGSGQTFQQTLSTSFMRF